jgi:hypothetical protein
VPLPCVEAAAAASFGIMTTARIVYRYLTAVFIADVLLQLFLAGAGEFSAGAGIEVRESSALDPHRVNGMAVMLLALLMLAATLVARNGQWTWALPLFVLSLLQPLLAIAGSAGGLHVLNAAAILVVGSVLAYRARRRDGRGQPESARATDHAARRPEPADRPAG